MIVRDDFQIILQHPIDRSSGGDSARSEGMMALFGSELDQRILWKFEVPMDSGLLTRHPVHYDHQCFTRDQLLCFLAGAWKAGEIDLCKRVFWSHAKRLFFCQNQLEQFSRHDKGWWGRDPLSPSHIGFIILCAKLWYLYPFLVFALPWFYLDLWWATRHNPRMEQNQTIAMAMVYGKIKLWAKAHPNWKGAVKDYWCGWRDQSEIADQIIKGVEKELEKEQLQ